MPKKAGKKSEVRRLLSQTDLSLREVARRANASRTLVNAIAKAEFPDRQLKAPPKYRLHRGSGLAFIEVDGKREYLGPYASNESRQLYHTRLAQLAATKAAESPEGAAESVQQAAPAAATNGKPILDELLWRFWKHATDRYRDESGRPSAHLANIRQTIKKVTEQFGTIPIDSFGPSHIRAFREKLIEGNASRNYVNKLVGHVKQIFAWGMEEEIVSELIAFRVIKTKNLKAGRSAARETAPVEPVADVWVDATLPFLPTPVRAMVQLQRITGMRSSNICEMRPSEIDMRGKVWIYTPRRHKTQHLGHRLRQPLGPRAQAVIRPLITTNLDAFLFNPREASEEGYATRSAARKTKRYGQQLRRTRKDSPKLRPGDCYDARSYCRAINRGIEKANRAARWTIYRAVGGADAGQHWLLYAADEETRREVHQALALRIIPHWHPHQLRHARSTEVRQRYGLDGAQVALSHRDRRTTER